MISEFLEARREYSRQLSRYDGIRPLGIGVGLRNVDGRRLSDLSVQVFVSTKRPLGQLSRKARIPGTIAGIPIDIVESPHAVFSGTTSIEPCQSTRQLRVGRGKYRPLKSGISCSNLYSCSGTLGAFCEGLNHSGRPAKFILGCGHVLRGRGTYKTTRAIIQASPADGGTSKDTVAVFDRDIPVHAGAESNNSCDAAIAEVLPEMECIDEIVGIGRLGGKTEPVLGMRVLKSGRTTGLTSGIITSVALETRIRWNAGEPGTSYRFIDLVRIETDTPGIPFSLPGDSGALIVSADTCSASALYFAGSDDGSFGLAASISTVETELGVQLTGIA